jgi:hypothetical protein
MITNTWAYGPKKRMLLKREYLDHHKYRKLAIFTVVNLLALKMHDAVALVVAASIVH